MTILSFLIGLSAGLSIGLVIILFKSVSGLTVNVALQKEQEPPPTPANTLQELQAQLDKASDDLTERNHYLDEVIESINDIMNGGTGHE